MFKNLKIFLLSKPLSQDEEKLESLLNESSFSPCSSQEISKTGWVSPFGKYGSTLSHTGSGNTWVTMQKEEKILPAAVVNQAVDEKVALIEQESGSPVSKRQKRDIKEDITFQLLPKAFSKLSKVHGVVAQQAGLLWVDAASDNKAEELTALLRQSIGSLPISQIPTAISPTQLMTNWILNNEVPEDIELGDEAELRDSAEDGGIIRVKQQLLTDDEITAHLRSGKQVSQLKVTWDNTLTCIITADLSIKRIRFTDVITEQNDDLPAEDVSARLDADFILMSSEINRFAKRLLEIFATEEE